MFINLGRKTYNVAAFGYKYEYPWVANCSFKKIALLNSYLTPMIKNIELKLNSEDVL